VTQKSESRGRKVAADSRFPGENRAVVSLAQDLLITKKEAQGIKPIEVYYFNQNYSSTAIVLMQSGF
jgi:hypothetical protein